MKGTLKKSKKNFAALIIIVLTFIIAALLYLGGIFDYLENKTYDFRVKALAGQSRPSDDIIVILLDQRSIDWGQRERGWSWPWPRAAYAELTDYMKAGGANSLTLDVLFSEPSVYGPQDDEAFAQASARFGRVVQAAFFSSQAGKDRFWPAGLNKPLFSSSGGTSLPPSRWDTLEMAAQFPLETLRNTAEAIGSTTNGADPVDDVYRRAYLFTPFDHRLIPGLAPASLLASGSLQGISYDQKKQTIQWGDYTLPVDKDGGILLRFRGEIDRYIPYSASDVLQSAADYRTGETPNLPPEDFSGKYVFFGYNAPGLFDIFSTPISSVYPGVGVHITLLDNLLQGDFIREIPVWVNLLCIFLAAVLITLLTLYSRRIPLSVGGTVFLIAIIIALCFGVYHFGSLWLHLVPILFSVIAAFLGSTLYNYATEGSQKRFIKSAFSRYLSPKVIDQIIADPSKLNLGGEKREMTAIFTDIQRFSSISEALQKEYADDGPKVLVELLNLYLTEMSNIVLENGGTIDKYEGDAIIAFFGAPIWTGQHAALACRSAVKMKKRELELRAEIMKADGAFAVPLSKLIEGKAIRNERPLYTRIGINSGDMVVGNMGTPNKMDYTIMGNAVNLAARLEGVNKQYDTSGILISEYTRDKIGDDFILRGLSRVRVVGVNTPLRLYELLDTREDASPKTLKLVEVWEQGFAAYEKQKFPEALKVFKAICQADAQDLVAKKYLDRCEKYIAAPPTDEKWDDGVDNLTEK
ncbi:adenylate/guanylate cyclase domain-containing protein [Spirochaetia bacterium]|nr:adenylate/guanylate cyclase domain-containing protein [Spirochaetia bacterium]